MGNIKTFKELTIWQSGIKLVKNIYEITEKFPNSEIYSLASQMRRASISIPSNIAEGFRRHHSKEFKQFLNITLGSLAELETQLIISKELNYISKTILEDLTNLIDQLSRMVFTLHKKL